MKKTEVSKQHVVAHSANPSIWEAKAGELLQVGDQLGQEGKSLPQETAQQ